MIKLGLLGNNISKSEMPNFVKKLGNEFDFEIKYELFDQTLKTNFNFKNFLSQIEEKNISGINVTYPFKELAIEHSTKLSEETKLVKSTNLLLINESMTSHNTDYSGFLNTYKFNFNKEPSKLVVLGGGGVGKSVSFALIKLGVKELYIIEKDHNKLKKLIEDLKKQHEQVYPINLGELTENQHEFDGFLNCSEQGHINTPGNPFDGLELNSNQWSFDAVYTPAMTTFLKNSEKSGAKIITGIDLFLLQGIESFIIFTEQEKLRKKIMSNYDNIREYYFKKLITW